MRDAVGIEKPGHLGLAAKTVQAFADVEHGIPTLTRDESLGERADIADADGLVAKRCEGGNDPRDRDLCVELSAVLLAHSQCEIVRAKVVRDPNAHEAVRYSAAIGRTSRPNVPSGSG